MRVDGWKVDVWVVDALWGYECPVGDMKAL
jgi:hypothetical protein